MHTQPVEDIDSVMGRFQAWTGSRVALDTKQGVRELSCEEALKSRRYHWKANDDLSSSIKAAQPQPARAKPAPSKSGETHRKPAAKTRTRHHGAKPQTQAAASKAVTAAKSVAKTQPQPPATQFKDALAQAVRPAEVILSSAQPTELARQVAISIRLAPSERTLIRTRAAEAGITVSAYIRQCALEVEHLRAQVQQTIAAMEHRTAAPAAPPTPAPGFFARILRRFFPATAQALAIRA